MPKINFIYIGDYAYEVIEKPRPSSAFIPDWFKDMSPYMREDGFPEDRPIVRNQNSNASAKKCTPMLDGIVTGYTVPLWSDVFVEQSDEMLDINWRASKDVFQLHGASSRLVDPPPGYSTAVFKFMTWFRMKTPPGYSVMVRPPAGHYDLPFYAIPAVIDTDKSVIDNNLPVWVRSDFEGIVEKGTPIAQIIPFKRESWKAEFDVISEERQLIDEDKTFGTTIKNNYIKNIWSKKSFK
jgi:hypothetical protein